MKKILIILGGFFVVLIIAGVVGFSILAVKGKALDEESKAYVDKVTPTILAYLNQETLFQYASEELKKSGSQEDFEKLFKWFERLGKFIDYKESVGQAHISVTTQHGKLITGHYQAQAVFENGPATIEITTRKKENDWEIIFFRIKSMALVGEST